MSRARAVTRAVRVLGDRWSIMIVRDAFQGVHRFQDFLQRSGASRATLTSRLRSLVASGVLQRVPYSHAPLRYEYRLTPKGRDLYPLSLVAWKWERRWAPRGAGIPMRLFHRTCGREMRPETCCGHCGSSLHSRDVDYVDGPHTSAVVHPTRLRRLSGSNAANHRGTQATLTHIADIVGDPWSPLVLAAAFLGLRRFDDLQRELGIATNTLTLRLALLVRRKILRRQLYTRRPARYEYRLTDKGRDLFPYALVLNAWGERWLPPTGANSYTLQHRGCGHRLVAVVRCSHCQAPLLPGSVTTTRAVSRQSSP